jgi:hypothetical protein
MLWRALPDKLEQGTRVFSHDQAVQSCALWPGNTHDLVLSTFSDGICLVDASVRVEVDECGVKYAVSSLPQLPPAMLAARRRARGNQQQSAPAPAPASTSQHQHQHQHVGGVERYKAKEQPLAMSLHAGGRLTTVVTADGSIAVAELQEPAAARARRLWKRAMDAALERQRQARQQVLRLRRGLSGVRLRPQHRAPSPPQRAIARYSGDSVSIPTTVSSSEGDILVVCKNYEDEANEDKVNCDEVKKDKPSVCRVLTVGGAVPQCASSSTEAATVSSCRQLGSIKLKQDEKVVRVVPCVEAGWVSWQLGCC